MAEEEKKEEAAAEGGEQKAASDAGKGGLFSPKNLAIIGVMVVVLGAGAFFGIKMLTGGSEEGTEESEKPKQIEKSMPGTPFDFASMVVNISGTQGTRYLKVTVSLELDDSEGLLDEVTQRMSQFQDIMTTEFSSVTLDQVDDPAAKSQLKFRLRQKFNDTLKSGEIKNIYFRDYVIQ